MPQELLAAVMASGLQTLAISDLHAELAAAFDWDHRDPWDRILAAQGRLEHCTFVSTDVVFDNVLHERIWTAGDLFKRQPARYSRPGDYDGRV